MAEQIGIRQMVNEVLDSTDFPDSGVELNYLDQVRRLRCEVIPQATEEIIKGCGDETTRTGLNQISRLIINGEIGLGLTKNKNDDPVGVYAMWMDEDRATLIIIVYEPMIKKFDNPDDRLGAVQALKEVFLAAEYAHGRMEINGSFVPFSEV